MQKEKRPKPVTDKRQSVNIKRFIAKENKRGMKVTSNGMITAMTLRVSRRTANNLLEK